MAVSVGSPTGISVPFSSRTVPSVHSAASRSSASTPSGTSPSASEILSPANTLTRVILFWVSVPVLSEQITDALPSVSTAGSLRMIAFLVTIRCTPMASTMVTMAGSPSGMAATARDTAVMNMSSGSSPSSSPTTKMTAQITSARIPRYFPSCASLRCKGVTVSPSFSSSAAILPISVRIPVSTTSARPRP